MLFTLYKIVLLTLFYEVITFLADVIFICILVTRNHKTSDTIFVCSLGVLSNIVSVVFSYAMYLMMDHNVKEYVGFLKMNNCLKLHFFCYKHMVNNQLHELTVDENQLPVVVENNAAERDPKTEVSFETNVSVMQKSKKSQKSRVEISVETTVCIRCISCI